MTWMVKNLYTVFNLIDLAGGSTLHQKVNISGVLRFGGVPKEVAGGVYHQ